MTTSKPPASKVPPVVALYGWLGLIPFFAPPIVGWAFPATAGLAGVILVAYGALILSFLGGARWGLAVHEPQQSAMTISLAMLPSLVALGLVATPSLPGAWRLVGLALALLLHSVWDVRSKDLPQWYSKLRTTLTIGAISGLMLGVIWL